MSRILGLTLAALLSIVMPLGAQEAAKPVAPEPAAQPPSSVMVPLRIQLVVSRFQGDKKISSIPYVLAEVANDREKTSLRMGVDVPVPAGPGSASFNYRSVGTNIDCTANSTTPGVFRVALTVSDSSVFATDQGRQPEAAVPASSRTSGMPAFRSFQSDFDLLLRDGQTASHVAATDPVSGEVLKIDVTLNVIK